MSGQRREMHRALADLGFEPHRRNVLRHRSGALLFVHDGAHSYRAMRNTLARARRIAREAR